MGWLEREAPQAACQPTHERDETPAAPLEPERRTAPIELLWDLVFVFAVTRVTTLLAGDLSWAGFGRSILVLALVWWAWSAFAWVTDAEDPDSTGFRLALMLGACLIFITGLALPQAFGSEGLLFAVSYACVRFMHLGLYVVASRRGNASMAAIAGFSVTVAIGMALLIAGAFAHGSARIALWVLAAAIDYMGPAWLTRDRLRGLQRVTVVHFAERYALFIIICLGESIAEIGVGASQHALTAATIAAAVLGVLTAGGFWWVYFDRSAGLAESRLRAHDEPVLAAADAYSYLHLLLVAGIIVFAAGVKYTLGHVEQPLPQAPRLALFGGASAYLAGHVAFRLRILGTLDVAQLVVAGALLILFAASGSIAAWVVVAILGCAVWAMVAWELVQPTLPISPVPSDP
jgi:low temperature requirement protein LtrA